jgi:two-component system sensor histidine kinase EvgS
MNQYRHDRNLGEVAVPVLMTSGYIHADDEQRARAAGIRELILKPVTVDEMSRVLERLLDAPQPPVCL